MVFLGELPGMIYDAQRGRYFKKGSFTPQKQELPHVQISEASVSSSLIQPIVYNQIYDRSYCRRQATTTGSIGIESLPNPMAIQYPYIKLFVIHCTYLFRLPELSAFLTGMPFHQTKRFILLKHRFRSLRRHSDSAILNLMNNFLNIWLWIFLNFRQILPIRPLFLFQLQKTV